jgi:hypothetical protein
MRMRVCYIDCYEAELCCNLMIHNENLLRPLQLFYFHLWPTYWLSFVQNVQITCSQSKIRCYRNPKLCDFGAFIKKLRSPLSLVRRYLKDGSGSLWQVEGSEHEQFKQPVSTARNAYAGFRRPLYIVGKCPWTNKIRANTSSSLTTCTRRNTWRSSGY